MASAVPARATIALLLITFSAVAQAQQPPITESAPEEPAAMKSAPEEPDAREGNLTEPSPEESLDLDSLLNMSFTDLLDLDISVASKALEKAQDAPSSVTVFTRQEIRALGVTTVEELLNFVPGFQTGRDVEQGTAFRIAARGRSTALSESILFMVDGQRINDLYTGGISIINRYMTANNIQQLEVIRGPGSALYGSNAFTGVVNIRTRPVGDETFAEVDFSAGSFNGRGLVSRMGYSSGDLTVSGTVSGFSDEGDLFRNVTDVWGITRNTRDPVNGFDGNLGITYGDLSVQLRHMERKQEGFLTFGSHGEYDNNDASKQSSANGSYVLNINEDLAITGSAGYGTERWKAIALGIPPGIDLGGGFMLDAAVMLGPLIESRYAHAGLDLQWNVVSNGSLTAGLLYEYFEQTRVSNLFNHHPVTLEYVSEGQIKDWGDAVSFNREKARKIIGAFAQYRHKIHNLSATVGVRSDTYDDFGTSLNPRLGLVYATPVDSKVKLLYGRAFRAPNFLELYDYNNPVDFGNADLIPEVVNTIEVAYVQRVGDVLQITGTYFNHRIDHQIILGGDPDDPNDPNNAFDDPNNPYEAPRFTNTPDKSTTQGVEFELRAEPIRRLQVYASLTAFIRGASALGDARLPQAVPKVFGSGMLTYRRMHWTVGLNTTVHGGNPALPDQGAYALFGGRVSYAPSPMISFYVTGKNISDKKYNSVAARNFPEVGVPARGRTVMIGIEGRFTAR